MKKTVQIWCILCLAAAVCNAMALELIDLNSAAAEKQLAASGQPDAGIRLTGGKLTFTLNNTKENPWPGIEIRPADGSVWKLENYGYIDVSVTNPAGEEIQLFVRADDSSKLVVTGAWATGQKKIKAGATDAVRVYLTDLSYGRKYILQRDHISRLLIFGGIHDKKIEVTVNSVTAGGKAGEAPAWHKPLIRPEEGGVLADFKGNSENVTVNPRRANARQEESGLQVTFRPDGTPSGVLIAPKDAKWSLIYFNQMEFHLRNPGDTPQELRCGINNWLDLRDDQSLYEQVTLAPGESRIVVVPFAGRKIWRSAIQSDGKAKTTDAASERVRSSGETGGSNLTSDEVCAVSLAGKSGSVILEKVVASVAAPDILPEWSGSRPPVDGDWKLTLDENFDGETLNTGLWNQKMPWVGLVPGELQRYNPKNSFVKDGMLHLRAIREKGHLNGVPNQYVPEGEYTSAVVTSYDKWSQRYGYFEARLKVQKAIGVWPAFWAMPYHGPGTENRRKGTRQGGAEIDIFEHPTRFGPYRSNVAVHWDDYGPDHKKTGSSRIYYSPDKDGFVTAGILWEPGRITWYVNQKIVGVWESPAVPSVAIYLKFTIQMGSWGGYTVEDEKLPEEDFLIDYVRVWQRSTTP